MTALHITTATAIFLFFVTITKNLMNVYHALNMDMLLPTKRRVQFLRDFYALFATGVLAGVLSATSILLTRFYTT